MKQKKSSKADLQNRRILFLEIGLVVALGLVVASFSYTPDEYRIRQLSAERGAPLDVMLSSEFIVVPNDEEQSPIVVQPVGTRRIEPPQVEKSAPAPEVISIYSFPDYDAPNDLVELELHEMIPDDGYGSGCGYPGCPLEILPSFEGGDINRFRAWVVNSIKYPAFACDNNINGRVVASFVIDKEGRVTEIKVLRSSSWMLSQEVVRILELSPRWMPARQQYKNVSFNYILPIEFQLEEE